MHNIILAILIVLLPYSARAEQSFKFVEAVANEELLNEIGIMWASLEETGDLVRLSLNKKCLLGNINSLYWVINHDNGDQSRLPIDGYSINDSHNINYEFRLNKSILQSSYFEASYLEKSGKVMTNIVIVIPE